MKEITTRFITKGKLPLVIEPTNKNMKLQDLLELIKGENKYFKQNMLTHGGLLFRGFPINHENDFTALMKSLGLGEFMDYIGGDSPRTKVSEGVYTSTEAPPSIKIPLHNELSFVKNYPRHICFYCVQPSITGGETILGDSRKIYQAIDKDVMKRFVEKNLKYVSAYYYKSQLMEMLNKLQRSHKSWLQVFETENKKEVERMCRENDFELKWNKHDWLQIAQTRPAVIAHPETRENVWFNQVHLYDFNPRLLGWWRYVGAKIFYCRKYTRLHDVFFADNTRIPRDDLYHIMDTLDANTVAFPWKKGDVVVLDNILSMHGRSTFSGRRRILTSMCG